MTALELWAPICRAPAYGASSVGRVRRSDTGYVLKLTPTTDGYFKVNLGESARDQLVHRLVMEAFAGPCPPGKEVRHLDGNPANNRWAPGETEDEVRAAGGNLFYGTHIQNMQDSVHHGTRARGSRNGNSRLLEAEVAAIRTDYARGGISQRTLAAQFGVSQRTIWNIVNEEQWRHS